MASQSVEMLLKRSEKAWQRRQQWVGLHKEAYTFALPERDPVGVTTEGARKSDKVFDSTAVQAVSRFANRIQSVMFPPRQRWATLDVGPEIPAERKTSVQEQLEEIEDKLWPEIHRSNWDIAVNEAAHDLAVGTGLILVQSRTASRRNSGPLIQCQAVPAPLVALEEGPWGVIEAVYWKQKLPAHQIQRIYPDAQMPAALSRKVQDDPNQEIELDTATYYDPDDDIYRYEVIWKGTDPTRLVEREHRTMPWIAMRWLKAAGEVDGRGPVIQALPDIKTANKVVELVLKSASLSLVPILTAVDDGILNVSTVRLTPGAIIKVGSNGGVRGPSLQPLPRTGDVQMANLVLEDLRMSIRDALFDRRLPPEAGPVRSPTEIMERMKELQRDIGAAFGRLISDVNEPAIARFLDILDEAGKVQMTIKVDGQEIAVRATSPLAQVQNLEDVQTVTQYLALVAETLGIEAAQDAVKGDEVMDFFADKLGVPQRLISTAAERKEAREGRAQRQEAAMLATSPVAAKVADNATKPQPQERRVA